MRRRYSIVTLPTAKHAHLRESGATRTRATRAWRRHPSARRLPRRPRVRSAARRPAASARSPRSRGSKERPRTGYGVAPPSAPQSSTGMASAALTVHSPPTSRRRAFPQFGQRRSVASRSGSSPGALIEDSTRDPQFGQASCSLSKSGVTIASKRSTGPMAYSDDSPRRALAASWSRSDEISSSTLPRRIAS